MGSSVILPSPGQPTQGPDSGFKSGSTPNLVSFGFSGIDPPSPLYIQRDDVLALEAVSQLAGEVVQVTVRLLIPAAVKGGQPDHPQDTTGTPFGLGPGYVQTSTHVITGLTAYSGPVQLLVPLLECYLLSVTAIGTSATIRGQTFARAFLNRGPLLGVATRAMYALFSDYVTGLHVTGWPYGGVHSPADSVGAITRYAPANPAAGADINTNSGTPGRVRVAAIRATFTASAAAGNRVVSFLLSPASSLGLTFQVQDTVAVTAGQVVTYNLAPGGTNVRGAGAGTAANPLVVTLPVPSPAILGQTANVKTVTQGILAGDQWSAITLDTEEWLDLF